MSCRCLVGRSGFQGSGFVWLRLVQLRKIRAHVLIWAYNQSSGTHKELLISMCKLLLLKGSSKRCYNTSTSSQIFLIQLSMSRGHIASSTCVLYMWHRIWYVPVPHFHSSISQLNTRSLKKEWRKTLTVSRTHTYKHMQTHIHTTHIQHTHTQKTNSSKTNIKINKTKRNKMKTLQKLTKPYLTKQTLSLTWVQLHF